MALAGFDHYLPQLLFFKVDMTPLKCHHVNNTKAASMESKEEHFHEFLSPRFLAILVIFQ